MEGSPVHHRQRGLSAKEILKKPNALAACSQPQGLDEFPIIIYF